MPGSINCSNTNDITRCQLFQMAIQYNDPANLSNCKLDSTTSHGEIVFTIQGKANNGSEEWCELWLMESTGATPQPHIEFADDYPNPVFQSGYIRVYKTVNSDQTMSIPLKILIKKAQGATKRRVNVTCKFRHSLNFDDSCTWTNVTHTMQITIEVE